HERRRGGSQAGAAGVISGAGIGLVMAALGVMLPLAIAVGGGIAASTLLTVRRNYLRDARLAQLALEQTLDRLEFGEATKGKLFSL
ncbi:MAG TPA: hypothetical protein PK788_05000, partial [Gemmatimonadaceae bacterium]|nr:hypothetical protein [Gemmatimonadaceae bacterium]